LILNAVSKPIEKLCARRFDAATTNSIASLSSLSNYRWPISIFLSDSSLYTTLIRFWA
jgi:hypothetical protein